MKINVKDATLLQLDWLVAECEGKQNDCEVHAGNLWYGRVTSGFVQYRPSTNWSQGGPIIEREGIVPHKNATDVAAYYYNKGGIYRGPTPLIAAMRCYVASKLGDEVEIPEELA